MSPQSPTHRIDLRVYYEDTDLAGIVYYANYLKFIERGRTEWLRDLGINQVEIKAQSGTVFAVRKVVADYLAPAVMDDALLVLTQVTRLSRVRIVLLQQVLRGDQVLFTATVTLAALGPDLRPRRLPGALANRLEADPALHLEALPED